MHNTHATTPHTALSTQPAHSGRRRSLQALGLAALAPSALLAGCAAVPAGPAVPLAGAGTAPDSAAGPTGNTPAMPDTPDSHYRLLNRLTWGATDASLERLSRLGSAAFIREQLDMPPAAQLPPAQQAQIDALRIQQQPLADVLAGAEAIRKSADTGASEDARKAAQEAYQRELTRLARESATRHLLRALYAPSQLHEQMTWFWINHFNVHQYKSNLRAMLGDFEERAIRPHAMGPFRTLLGAVARHPAMLRYLDNDQNAGGRINENYARELLELHTLGVDGGYSQHDVQELARVLTGHGINTSGNTPKLKPEQAHLYVRDGLYEFNPARHDFGDKTLLGRTIRGRGAAELDEVLDLLAAHPATARFLSRKMAQYLLADSPPPALVDRMAQAYTASGASTRAALAPLLLSPAFAGAEGAKFKDPMHYVVSAVRAAYGDKAILNTVPMQNWLNRLGEGLYNRQTPDGYPMTADAWNGSGQLATRFEIARTIGAGSAGLFKPEDPADARQMPAFPQLLRPIYYSTVRNTLRPETRAALDAAGSPQDWNALYLASPDFMFR